MPEMRLRQPGFTHTVCGPFTKNKEIIQKFKETGDSRYIYKTLRDKAFNIDKNQKHNRYKCGLASVVFKLFHKKTSDSGIKI